MEVAARQAALDALLQQTRPLWAESPFKTDHPAWCANYPALAAALLALADGEVARLTEQRTALIELCAQYVPALTELAPLLALPTAPAAPAALTRNPHLDWEIPGRKQEQIAAFAAAIGVQQGRVVDWCAGKGHLGRLIAAQGDAQVTSLERDAALCEAGRALARRVGITNQCFHAVDVLQADAAAASELAGAAVLALHACGDLHRALCAGAAERQVRALHVAPCCHNRGLSGTYEGRTGMQLRLEPEHLRLAIQDTVTAPAREIRLRERELAWKLAFVAWRRSTEAADYRPFKSVPDRWLKGDFASFMNRLAAREDCPAPAATDIAHWQETGHARARKVARLNLARLAFSRALEIWYVADQAVRLTCNAYQVRLSEFCPRRLTPRNLLLQARRE
ncbi:MAG: methyltransferase [Rhodocyclaceae bacterium]|nr:methyltransferase [Rhodocyclaceae bacterium]